MIPYRAFLSPDRIPCLIYGIPRYISEFEPIEETAVIQPEPHAAPFNNNLIFVGQFVAWLVSVLKFEFKFELAVRREQGFGSLHGRAAVIGVFSVCSDSQCQRCNENQHDVAN